MLFRYELFAKIINHTKSNMFTHLGKGERNNIKLQGMFSTRSNFRHSSDMHQ